LCDLSEHDKVRQIKKIYGDLEFFEKIYDEYRSWIKNHVYIKYNNQQLCIKGIEFHPRYGWAIQNNNKKAYLGKSSIFGLNELYIGTRTYLSGHSVLRGSGNINIGSYSSIGFGLYILAQNDKHLIQFPDSIGLNDEGRMGFDKVSIPLDRDPIKTKKNFNVSIGNDVWIGKNVHIMPGTVIHNGCVIGTNSIVTKDCEPYGIYAGTPAKLIRHRFMPNVIEELLEFKWWNWSRDQMKSNKKFFETDLSRFKGNLKEFVKV